MTALLTLPEDVQLAALLPQDRPFLTAGALDAGLRHRDLTRLVECGLLRRPVKGVYVVNSAADTLDLRLAALRLVVPADCVVTDRSAGWLWVGDRILAPNDHLQTPKLSVFGPPGRRLRNGLVHSGERRLEARDIVVVAGVRVTTPLRTACDLGRLLHRDQALGAMDLLASLPDAHPDAIAREISRFRGYRYVTQLRSLAPLVDSRCRWPSESILRLRWYDAGLPRPQCQIEVPTPWGSVYALDLGLAALKYAAEYDGERYHGEDRRAHDKQRRDWLRREEGWVIVVARRDNVHGHGQDIERRLREGYREALETAPTRLGVSAADLGLPTVAW